MTKEATIPKPRNGVHKRPRGIPEGMGEVFMQENVVQSVLEIENDFDYLIFYLSSIRELELRDIADVLGITFQRVDQIVNDIRREVQENMKMKLKVEATNGAVLSR